MLVAILASVCLAGSIIMLFFLVKLHQDSPRRELVSQPLTQRTRSLGLEPCSLPLLKAQLGGTYEYQDAILRWPVRQLGASATVGVRRGVSRRKAPATDLLPKLAGGVSQ
jgi:hypothetical protein